MKKLLGLFGGLLATSANAGVDLKHDEFTFSLGGDWKQVQIQGQDPDQFTFESKEKNTSVVLSVMKANIPKERLVEVAKKFAEIRKQKEQEARAGQDIHFGDQWVDLKGDVADVAYAAYDNKTIFRFYGFITQRKVLSLWVSTEPRDNELSKRVFDEVFKGLKFYVP